MKLQQKNPTLNSEGILTHTCSVCGDSYTTSIPKLSLTQNIWINSLTEEKIKNKYIQLYFEDTLNNKMYDITLSNKEGIYDVLIYDYNTSKTYEYYHNSNEVIESCVGGFRHALYNNSNDPYIEYIDKIINSIYYSSFAYDKVEWKDNPENYFIAQGIEIQNHLGQKETATVAISIDDNLNLLMYAYSSSAYMINIQEKKNMLKHYLQLEQFQFIMKFIIFYLKNIIKLKIMILHYSQHQQVDHLRIETLEMHIGIHLWNFIIWTIYHMIQDIHSLHFGII